MLDKGRHSSPAEGLHQNPSHYQSVRTGVQASAPLTVASTPASFFVSALAK
jgi:hypothetical protein